MDCGVVIELCLMCAYLTGALRVETPEMLRENVGVRFKSCKCVKIRLRTGSAPNPAIWELTVLLQTP